MHYLPAHVSSLLQPKTFRLRKDSFVDASLQEYFSDLLYQVDFKEADQGFVYILFEHKSYPSRDIAFQLLRYMTRIWEYASKQSGGSLPPVIPVVLYHGTDKWSIPLNFASLYQGPESLRQSLCDFTYYLCDLSTYTDEELKMGAMATVAVLLLKHIHRDDLVERLTDVLGLLRAMNEQTALEFLETILRYLGAATERVSVEDCRKAVQAAITDTGDLYMDRLLDQMVAEHLAKHRPKWVEEAMQEGMKEGTASLTVRLLTRKFGCLDTALEDRVRQLPIEELERLGDELLDLPSASALTQWLDSSAMKH